MSIVFVAGTTAEIIKIAPVMRELRERGVPTYLWSTDQHVSGVQETLVNLQLAQPDRHLVPERRRKHIAASRQVPGWLASVAGGVLRQRRALLNDLRANGTTPVVVVHGDTFTTVLGSLIGRLLRATVAHVEAGLRSGSMLSPFPEEANRRVVGRLATLHFAPTQREVENLRREHAPGEVVLTGANTVVDALRLAAREEPDDLDLPAEFGLVTLHRFELLRQGEHFSALLRLLARRATETPLVMVVGEAERARIAELGLDGLFGDRFRMVPKRSYARFLPVLARAAFVVTDSGGLQEECAVLGTPCAVHRERTERHQGLGENVMLTRFDLDEVAAFLDRWREYRRPSTLDDYHPSKIIVDHLERAVRST